MNYNKILLMGNLTRNPELSYLPNQTAVVSFGIAVNRKYKDKEETLFIDCTAFGNQAENINKYMQKGNPIFIEGRLTKDQWTQDDGVKREKYKVIVERFQFLGVAQPAQRSLTIVSPQTEPKNDSFSPQNDSFSPKNDSPQQSVFEDEDIPF